MANIIKMKFKKGDTTFKTFKMPLEEYTPGGTLWFAAKPEPDNDPTDATAVIDKSFTDADVTLTATQAIWTLKFEAGDITDVNYSGGESAKEYKGEFQWVEADSTPHSYPSDDSYIQVIIYADIKRGVV